MYNLCIIQPTGYVHSAAFDEISQLLMHAFHELGISCTVTKNQTDDARRNVIIGSHLIPSARSAQFPASTIILNTEQLFSSENPQWSELVTEWGRKHYVWDYNEKNILNLKARGVKNAALLKIGYQPELQRIPKADFPSTDVLFYGSFNGRRTVIIERLRQEGLNVKTLFGVYGEERDREIANSKVILNMHFYDQHIFEVVRVFYLLTNSKAVVAEVGGDTSIEERFLSGVAPAPYNELVATCKRLVKDSGERRLLEERALGSIRAWPQSRFLQELLAVTA